jgi:hypothetical protein
LACLALAAQVEPLSAGEIIDKVHGQVDVGIAAVASGGVGTVE